MSVGLSAERALAWLEARLGDVPDELAVAVRSVLEAVEPAADTRGGVDATPGANATPAVDATPADVLAEAALAELDSVVGAAERDRRTALRLLSADALLTYAFEAAADPEVGGSAALAERLAERTGPRGALGDRIAGIEEDSEDAR